MVGKISSSVWITSYDIERCLGTIFINFDGKEYIRCPIGFFEYQNTGKTGKKLRILSPQVYPNKKLSFYWRYNKNKQ